MSCYYAFLVCIILSYCNLIYSGSVDNFNINHICADKSSEKGYAISQKKLDWVDAFFFCRERQMELVSITSKEDSDKLEADLKKYGQNINAFWTSARRRDGVKGDFDFVWFSDGTPLSYTNWYTPDSTSKAPAQPDSSSLDQIRQDCLVLSIVLGRPYKWFDDPCNQTIPFVCQTFCEYNDNYQGHQQSNNERYTNDKP